MKKHYFVDLFAGCGGLSLGLENSGFIPAYVNELDKDAKETYLINRDEAYPLLRKKYHSSDIAELTSKKMALEKLEASFEEDYEIKKHELDLIVGGPPCQGYSGIGHRRSYMVEKKDIPSNYLYKDMKKVIEKMRPKGFLFENVGGLMVGRWTPHGQKGEIWEDVKKSFESIKGYRTKWALVHAKSYGVPQNRPRVILIGLSDDIVVDEDENLPAGGFLPMPTNDYPHPVELLGDLVDPDYMKKTNKREIVYKKSTDYYPSFPQNATQKKMRTKRDGTFFDKGDPLTEQEYSKHSGKIREKFEYMLTHGGEIPAGMETKKFAQRVIPKKWGEKGPNITATSLPDDYVHFSQPRTLTVREWARLQMFPDWYQFAGKRTTGGTRRAGKPHEGIWDREVPKYTQIGNAVPVKLAEEIGKHLFKLMS